MDGPSGRIKHNGVVINQPTDTPIVGVENEVEEHDALETVKSKNGEKEKVAASSSVVEEDSSSEDLFLGEWWKNHILTQNDEEHTNVALLDGPFDHS